MRFATLPNGTPDGRLHIVSRDNARSTPAEAAETLQAALEHWDALCPALQDEYDALNAGGGGAAFDPSAALAPLPRTWQWLDGSVYDSHGKLMTAAYKIKAEQSRVSP